MQQAQTNGTQLITGGYFVAADCNDEVCKVQYTHHNERHEIVSRIIINASGPWINHVLQHITPLQSQLDIDLVSGTHIIVAGKLSQGMYYLEAPQDKRAVFVMPWKNKTGEEQILIGTTETPFNGSPEKVTPTEKEKAYLIEVYNHYFTTQLSQQDIIKSFAGLRVLSAYAGSSFHRSRDTIIHYNHPYHRKIFSIYGGKLTAHRVTAQQISKIIGRYLK